MKIKTTYNITFDTDEAILAATTAKLNETILLMSSGSVIRFNLDTQTGDHLFSVVSHFTYEDGGFDLEDKVSIYTLDEIVVVVNDFKTHAIVHYPGNYTLRLIRKDYYASISKFPMALYKNSVGEPHLIYGEAWNHVQIMNLDTRQVLTATKSLIEENAEERHIKFYKEHSEDNKLAWPRPYDYFFGELIPSPDQKYFISAGWLWGSSDCHNVYDIEKFLTSNRISNMNIGAWEHENRPTCWIDSKTIAVAYNPFVEGDEDANADSPSEIHVYQLSADTIDLVKKIPVEYKTVLRSRMHFSEPLNSFITVSDEHGLLIISMEGKTTFKDESLKANDYNSGTACFVLFDIKTLSVYQLSEFDSENAS